MTEIEESVATLHEAWKRYARGGTVEEGDGVLAAWAGAQWPIVNALFLTSPVGGVAEWSGRLDRIAAFTATRPQFGMLLTCNAWTPAGAESEAELSKRAWVKVENITGMVTDSPPAATPILSALDFRRVDSPELRQAVADINAVSYDVSLEMGREAVDREALFDDTCFSYVGFASGEAVTTATAYVQADCLYVALVATVPGARQRGYGAAATAHAMREAARSSGLGRTILHATSIGLPIYQQLGFRPVVEFSMHLPAPLLQLMGAGH